MQLPTVFYYCISCPSFSILCLGIPSCLSSADAQGKASIATNVMPLRTLRVTCQVEVGTELFGWKRKSPLHFSQCQFLSSGFHPSPCALYFIGSLMIVALSASIYSPLSRYRAILKAWKLLSSSTLSLGYKLCSSPQSFHIPFLSMI